MKFSPKAIFFDWDHTLWDHDRNANEVIQELFEEFPHQYSNTQPSDTVWKVFQGINESLWSDYQHGRIDQVTLRETRFARFFEQLGIHGDAQLFSDMYLERTPRKTHLIPGAFQVIQTLASKYPLYVLTNGFDDIQHIKITSVGMAHFFEKIITSDVAGCKKPAADFFKFALQAAECQASEVVMVGDHPIIDIQAAESLGIPSIHLNFREELITTTNQIKDLNELLELFE
jgi:YjjG family noncanonical pyrimidine nucleotidase